MTGLWLGGCTRAADSAATRRPESVPSQAPAAALPAPTPESLPPQAVPAVPAEPFGIPVGGATARIVSGFGKRTAPGQEQAEMHEGVDFAVTPGAPVVASRPGKVLFAGFSKMYASRANKKEQSRLIIVQHPDGMSTRYVHLGALRATPMQIVKAGDVLGLTAASDEWTSPVLHFEIRTPQGAAVDPASLLVPR